MSASVVRDLSLSIPSSSSARFLATPASCEQEWGAVLERAMPSLSDGGSSVGKQLGYFVAIAELTEVYMYQVCKLHVLIGVHCLL